MKKLLALLLALTMVLSFSAFALADEGSEPDWTEYNALISEVKTTTDFAARVEMMHKAEDILMGTGAIVPIYYYNDLYMAKETLSGYYSNPYGTKFFLYANKDKPLGPATQILVELLQTFDTAPLDAAFAAPQQA